MFVQAFNLCYQAVSWIFSLFKNLMDYFGFGGLLLTLFTIYTITRLLLRPLFGSVGSDFASSAKGVIKRGAKEIDKV